MRAEWSTRFVALAAGGTLALLLCAPAGASAAARPSQPGGGAAAAQRAVLQRYCVPCHNERNKANAGGLTLAAADLARIGEHAEVWEQVVVKLRAGLMPPARRPRPEPAARAALVAFLEAELDRHAAAHPDPGRTEAFHRLNRAEYRNAVRDLLGLQIDVTPLLPADDASHGFDNIAGVSRLGQSRLEQYLTVARRISRAAIGSPRGGPQVHEFRVAETARQYERAAGLPFGTRGGLLVRHHFPQDATYEIETCSAASAANATAASASPTPTACWCWSTARRRPSSCWSRAWRCGRPGSGCGARGCR